MTVLIVCGVVPLVGLALCAIAGLIRKGQLRGACLPPREGPLTLREYER